MSKKIYKIFHHFLKFFVETSSLAEKNETFFTMHYFQIVQLLFIQIHSINLAQRLYLFLLLSLWFVLLFISLHTREYISSAYMQSISLLIRYPQYHKSVYQDSYLQFSLNNSLNLSNFFMKLGFKLLKFLNLYA